MNGKERFSNRVDAYVKYRPGYPAEAIDYLYKEAGLLPESEMADIGAGTGIFTRLSISSSARNRFIGSTGQPPKPNSSEF